MINIFKYDINYTNGFNTICLYLTVLNSIITGIVVIIIKNPIVSILFLIGLFLHISANLMFLGLNFLGLSYLVVYVGAVSILFLFILMLINIRISEIISSTRNSIPLAISVGLLLFSTIYYYLPISKNNFFDIISETNELQETSISNWFGKQVPQTSFASEASSASNNNLMLSNSERNLNSTKPYSDFFDLKFFIHDNLESDNVYSNSWDSSISLYPHIISLGNILYTNFPILILLTSLVLLLSMVGSIIITIKT